MISVYCYKSGEIGLAECRPAPEGTVVIFRSERPLLEVFDQVAITARLAYDGETYLVPGVPEAESQPAAFDALIKWARWAFDVELSEEVLP